MTEERIAIAGSGPVAKAMGRALRDSGMNIACVASRKPEHANAAATFIGAEIASVRYADVGLYASRVLIAVSDSAIEAVAGELAASGGNLRIALHTCGAYGPEPLHALAEAGVSCGAIHPLQTIRGAQDGVAALQGIAFTVTEEPEAVAWAEEIASALEGEILRIDSGDRHLYHAAAVFASNYIAVLLDAAKGILVRAGLTRAQALRALAPIARASVENALKHGPVEALTGPIARGDAATVAAHMRALEASGEVELYRAAGLRALRIARERGLGDCDEGKIREALLGGR
jgi:predicted short-subunit dehydrogenase-like oxidoreductase (DUF2520 family)